MTAVTFKRIDQLYGDLTEIVNDPIAVSELSPEEQNRRVAKGCVQVCELLKDWLTGDVWNGMRASVVGPAADFAEYREQLDPMLQTLPDFLEQASGRMRDVRPELVDQARQALKAAAVRDQELFKNAEGRVGALRDEVCELARMLCDHNVAIEEKTKARVRARQWLAAITALLPALVIAMASVSPSQVAVDIEQWTRDVRTAIVIVDIAATAAIPSRQTGPPGRGETPHGVPGPAQTPNAGDVREAQEREVPTVRKAPQSVSSTAPRISRRTPRTGRSVAAPPGQQRPGKGQGPSTLGG
jgi:hypothetical protein